MLQQVFEIVERKRVQNHLRLTEITLRRRDTSGLPKALQIKRKKMLDELHYYWTKGVFPKNTNHPNQREAYFVDKFGTPCAMGYLMLCDKQEKLVGKIRASDNNIHLADVENGEVYDWIKDSGFTHEEAALVQPTYGERGFGGYPPEPVNTINYIPWIAGAVTYILLELLSFTLFRKSIEQAKKKDVGGLTYFSVAKLVISILVGVVASRIVPR